MLGLYGQEASEAAHGLGVQSLSGVGPGEGMGKRPVPGVDEVEGVLAQLFDGEEVTVFEALSLQQAEPDLDHVEPGGMEGNEVDDNAFVL